MRSSTVFLFSIFLSLLTLVTERIVGIDWDFHPDSITYATQSSDVSELILNDNFFAILNNAYYVICYSLGESVFLITAMNFLLFALSNILLCKLHLKLSSLSANISKQAVLLLLMNPYRLHLSTTMLKDTILIFLLLVIVLYGVRIRSLLLMLSIRLASVLYLTVFFNKRIIWYAAVVLFVSTLVVPEFTFILERFNSQEMNFREEVSINSFNDLGLVGIFLRSTLWPLMALSGAYLFIKPALMYIPLALGQWMQLLYMKKLKVGFFDVRVIGVLFLFAVMVTGFTSYLRYVMPLMVIAPFINVITKK